MQYEIKNRFTGAVQFTAEIDCADSAARSIKIGLAVMWGIANKADLSGADLSGADLSGANLIGAPVVPNIHAAVYAAATARPELFDMSKFAEGSGHTCGTAQCRAGWVLAVSGQAGLDLEDKIGTPAAAMAIYLASDPERWKVEKLPDFYCDNATALADMKRMAGVTE